MTGAGGLGRPRLHLRRTESTNLRASELAHGGAPHGTLVTAAGQTSGRGRQGRRWTAPAGHALLLSLVLRDPRRLLPLVGGVAVADAVDASATAAAGATARPSRAQLKWPNDVILDGRKVAGILVEGRPQESWAVLGIGLNVAVRIADLPPDLRDTAATLGLPTAAIEPVLETLIASVAHWLDAEDGEILEAVRSRDALLGRPVRWDGGAGVGAGIDGDGRLIVELADGGRTTLEAGEVHLGLGTSPGQASEE